MSEKYLVCNREHNWNIKRTYKTCFTILRHSVLIISFSLFIENQSISSFLILLSEILCFYMNAKVANELTITLSIFLVALFQNSSSIICWILFILFDLVAIPLLRKHTEKLRKCSIWKWDECSICTCYTNA